MADHGQLGDSTEVAKHLSMPPKTLAEWRSRGTGPRYLKIGRHVRYRWADVLAWEESRLVGGASGGPAAGQRTT